MAFYPSKQIRPEYAGNHVIFLLQESGFLRTNLPDFQDIALGLDQSSKRIYFGVNADACKLIHDKYASSQCLEAIDKVLVKD